MKLIPSIDIYYGRCVRLRQGRLADAVSYDIKPEEHIRRMMHIGFNRFHIVDLNRVFDRNPDINLAVVSHIAMTAGITVDIGGGIRNAEDARRFIDMGISQINIGTLSVTDERKTAKIIQNVGAKRVIICADFNGGSVVTHGWERNSAIPISDHIRHYLDHGVTDFICTDTEKDGMMSGSSITIYRELINEFPDIYLIASGGVSSGEEISRLAQTGVSAAVAGKALFENRDIKEFEKWK